MTHKDMNLVLDQRQPRQPARAAQTRPREVPGAKKRPPQGRTAKTRKSAARGTRPQGVPLAAVLLITLTNILLIAAAGYWLSLRLDQQAIAVTAAQPQANPRVELALTTLGEDMLRLEARVQDLQSALQAYQQETAAAHLRLGEQMKTPEADAPIETPAAVPRAEVPVPDIWIINAGTFPSRGEAERMATRISGLGHEAQLHSSGAGDRQTYRLQISGYADQASAEQAAQQIMAQTRLNGLWVSKQQ